MALIKGAQHLRELGSAAVPGAVAAGCCPTQEWSPRCPLPQEVPQLVRAGAQLSFPRHADLRSLA